MAPFPRLRTIRPSISSVPSLGHLAIALALLGHSMASALACDDKPNRYRNRNIFATLKESPNLPFGQNKNPLFNDQVINLAMDVFEPAGDTCAKRPVIIFMWGGGFQTGTRQNETGTCRNFARRGFVCVTSDYRKGVNGVQSPYNFGTPAFMSTQDTRAAIRYLRKNAALYRIDTSLIYVGGCSSGAYAASWTGYLDQESEIPGMIEPKAREGGIEGNSGNPGFSSRFAGVLALSGAVHDTNWIQKGDIPYAAAQCKGDPLVNPDGGTGGSGMRYFGGNMISKRMNGLGIPNRVLTYPGNCHCPRPTNAQGLDSTEDFFAKSAYEFMKIKEASVSVARPSDRFSRPSDRVAGKFAVAMTPDELKEMASQGRVFDLKGARVRPAGGFRPGLYLTR